MGNASEGHRGLFRLSAQAQILDQLSVILRASSVEISKQPAPSADPLEEPLAAVVILRVLPQMLREISDPLGEQCDLHRCRTTISGTFPVLLNERFALFLGYYHPVATFWLEEPGRSRFPLSR